MNANNLSGQHGAILIAEDSADDSNLLKHELSHLRYPNPQIVVTDGQEVIAYLQGENQYAARDKYPLPSLLVLDLQMKPRNGFAVLRWLQSHPEYKTFPILVLTVSEDRHEVREAYKLGASTFITKPITRTTLKEALDGMNILPLPPAGFTRGVAGARPETPASL